MLHILFFVLKMIGMILLAILGILILLLCMVLFIPANYQIQAKTDDGINALAFEAKAHWLLHLFTACYVYKDKQSDWQVRIGWKTFNHKAHEKQNSKPNDIETEEMQSSRKDKNTAEQSSVENEKPVDEEISAQKDSHDESNGDKSKVDVKQKQTWFEKIKCTIIKICDKIKSLWETKEKVTEFLTDDVHVEAFKIIKKEIGILARHLSPRRIKGFVRFGFDDPYRTGQVLAALSILYPFYGDNVEIYPDFEQKILQGDLYMKGHIRMVHLVALIWRLFFNRYIRKTYRDYKMLKSK